MKEKLLKTIMVLSLCVAGSLFAMDEFSALYPAENNDSPSYMDDTLDFDNLPATASGGDMDIGGHGVKSDHMDDFKAFYPLEDDDSAQY